MTQGLHQFIAVAGPWAYLVVGLMACAETAALVGLVVPGELTLLMAGFLAFTGHVSLPLMMVVAGVGAVAGDSISYRIGRRLGPRVRGSRLGRRVSAERWDRTEDYLRRRGGWAVLFGRWVGLLRALVPMLAGMGRLPYTRFLAYEVPGGLAWGAGTVGLGYAAGSSYALVEQVSGRVGLLAAAGLVTLAAAGLGVHRLTRPRTPVVECARAECARGSAPGPRPPAAR
ncbi:DedA family protein [Microbispora catharanthi]|uniref:DedA family protein n=1 Tax=Microbispora catharanthi TaxID=1712871 RepID=A0A5N6BZJ2_9ACTN|nr:DedA family protein [Microbispora catharanthi]KAB8185956.1 DedA family protein [Microbispora catharanthi]